MKGVGPNARVRLSVVIPIYNNVACIEELTRRLWAVLSEEWTEEYEIIFVDDGSRDESREMLRRLCAKDPRMRLIALSRNFGHQLAMTAGFACATGCGP